MAKSDNIYIQSQAKCQHKRCVSNSKITQGHCNAERSAHWVLTHSAHFYGEVLSQMEHFPSGKWMVKIWLQCTSPLNNMPAFVVMKFYPFICFCLLNTNEQFHN